MFDDPRGPIEHFSWGKFIICGHEHGKSGGKRVGKGKDIVLKGREVKRWKARKGHRLDPTMIEEVCRSDVEVLIIGNGVDGLVECPADVHDFVRRKGICRLIVEETPKACKTYNKLFRDGENVVLLAHGTC